MYIRVKDTMDSAYNSTAYFRMFQTTHNKKAPRIPELKLHLIHLFIDIYEIVNLGFLPDHDDPKSSDMRSYWHSYTVYRSRYIVCFLDLGIVSLNSL